MHYQSMSRLYFIGLLSPIIYDVMVFSFDDKYLLGQGMFSFLCQKLDPSGNYKFVTFRQGYHDIFDFGRYMLVCWRFYTKRWIFETKPKSSGTGESNSEILTNDDLWK